MSQANTSNTPYFLNFVTITFSASCRLYLMLMKHSISHTIVILFLFLSWGNQAQTFQNPLLDSGADPFSVYVDGYYYYTHTTGNGVVLWKTKNLANLRDAESQTIWTPPANTMYSKDIWAPEIHYIDHKWYVYVAADDGTNENHRMYVLENTTADPLNDHWEFKGKLAAPSDKWAIDGNVYTYKDQLYMAWSGWEGATNGQQDIFIAKMSDPLTISGKRIKISSPTYPWELNGDLGTAGNPAHVSVNEGPQFLEHDGNLFIVFSASGCWTDHYALGLLSLTGNDPMDAAAWSKKEAPIFKQTPENSVYAPGHNSFFKSPDGKEDWILYHANSNPGEGCGNKRSPRMQRLYWQEDGTPYIGTPFPTSVIQPIPSK